MILYKLGTPVSYLKEINKLITGVSANFILVFGFKELKVILIRTYGKRGIHLVVQ